MYSASRAAEPGVFSWQIKDAAVMLCQMPVGRNFIGTVVKVKVDDNVDSYSASPWTHL